jgi:RNA polymerase sigma-70 factor, ECF subfamily
MQNGTPAAGKNDVFLALRPYLYGLAYHMLAKPADAEDMVQECFLRWEKTDESKVRIPKAFLTTVVTRLCLKQLQSAHVQRVEYFGSAMPEILELAQVDPPDAHAQLADSLSQALLVVLKALSPLERAVFLLREVFDCEYSEIAGIVDKSEENCRQILRRAREGVASRKPRYDVMPQHEDQILKRFMQAAAEGDWPELFEVLSDDATLVCDGSNLGQGPVFLQGARSVAELIVQQASGWLGDGASIQMLCFQTRPGILACRNGLPVSSIFLSTLDGEIQSVCVITCPVRLRSLLVLN